MKKIFIITALLLSYSGFSQTANFNYNTSSEASAKNELSLFLKENVARKYVSKIKYAKNKEHILFSFYLDKNLQPTNVSTTI